MQEQNVNFEVIKKYLNERDIYAGGGTHQSSELLFGLILDKFIKEKDLTNKRVCIGIDRSFNESTSTDRYYFLFYPYLKIMQNSVKQNAVISKFITDIIGKNIKFYEDLSDGKRVFLIEYHSMNYKSIEKLVVTVAALIPRLLDDIFTNEDILRLKDYSNEVLEISKSPNIMSEVIKSVDVDFESMQTEYYKSKIIDTLKYDKDSELKSIQNAITRDKKEMERILYRCREVNDRIEKNNLLYNSLKMSGDDGYERHELFINFMINNDTIKNLCFGDGVIIYDVLTELKYYNIDILRPMLERRGISSHIYKNCASDAYFKLLNDIFINRIYTIRTQSRFQLLFRGGKEILIANSGEMRDLYPYRMPSPHAGLYNCPGGFRINWAEALSQSDFYSAVCNTIALAENINWGDYAVVSAMFDYLWGKTHKCLYDKDGNNYSLRELLDVYENRELKEKGGDKL